MVSSYQPRRAIIIMASLTWLIKKSIPLRWSCAFLNGRCWKRYPSFECAPARKRDLLGVQVSPKLETSGNGGGFWSHLSLGSHTAGVSSSRWPWHPADFPQPNVFWIDLGVLCLGFCCDGGVWWIFFVSFPGGKLQTRNFLQNLHWFCQYFTRKSFFPWEMGRNQDLRASQSAQTHCQCRGWGGAGKDWNL